MLCCHIPIQIIVPKCLYNSFPRGCPFLNLLRFTEFYWIYFPFVWDIFLRFSGTLELIFVWYALKWLVPRSFPSALKLHNM